MSPVSTRLLAVFPVALSAAIYLPVLDRYFSYDDFLHLYEIVGYGFPAFVFKPHGGHVLIPSNLAFLISFEGFGLDPRPYHALALLTHLTNVALMVGVLKGLTHRADVAAFGASLWGISPANMGSVGLFSAYGHVLAATGILWVLRDAACRRPGDPPLKARTLWRWYALLLLSGTSFGVGLGVATMFGAVLVLILSSPADRKRVAVPFATLMIVLPAIYLAGISTAEGESSKVANHLIFSMGFVFDVAAMTTYLIAWGIAGLLLGPLMAHGPNQFVWGPLAGEPIAAGGPVALATLALFSVFLLSAFVRARPNIRLQMVGCLLIVGVAYGLIALGRVEFYRLIDQPMVLAAIPMRYHYVGPMALTLTAGLAFAVHIGPETQERIRGRIAFFLWAPLAFVVYALTAPNTPSPIHAQTREAVRKVMDRVERSVRAQPVGSNVLIKNRPFPYLPPFDTFPGHAGIFLIAYPSNTLDGRRVYFVEESPEIHEAAAALPTPRASQLLIAP
ncbi:hypothetical protein MK489_22930 [Myxococcota bacterium]|nr:hypothetical protein [Myxococcota bacterium]